MVNKKNSGKAGKALLIGAAIGGALGVLLAPDKGSKTRQKIAAKPGEIKDAMKGKINDLLGKGNNTSKKIAAKPGEIKDAVKGKINDILDRAEKNVKTVKGKVKKA